MKTKKNIVIIGSGIGGLTAGLILLQEGYQVTVIEKENAAGGLCSTIVKNEIEFCPSVVYPFDLAVNRDFLDLFSDQQWVEGSYDRSDILYTCNLADQVILDVPVDFKRYIGVLKKIFPDEIQGLDEINAFLPKLFAEIETISRKERQSINPINYPLFFKNYRKTYLSYIETLIKDRKLIAILSALLLSEDMSLVALTEFLFHYHNQEYRYPLNGMQAIVNGYVKEIKKYGGRILLGKEAIRLNIENGYLKTVVLDDFSSVSCDYGIANISPWQLRKMFENPRPEMEAYFSRQEKLKPSNTFVSFIIRGKFEQWKEFTKSQTYLYRYLPSTDIGNWIRDDGSGMFYLHFLPYRDGETLVRIFNPINYKQFCQGYQNNPQQFLDAMKEVLYDRCQKIEPGFRNKIIRETLLTPFDYENKWGEYQGASFGWTMNPSQFGGNSLAQVTPIKNLILAGHWTFPGGGIGSVFYSGKSAANMIHQLAGAEK